MFESLLTAVGWLSLLACACVAVVPAVRNTMLAWRHVVRRDPHGSYIFVVGNIAALIGGAVLTPAVIPEPPRWLLGAWLTCGALDGIVLEPALWLGWQVVRLTSRLCRRTRV